MYLSYYIKELVNAANFCRGVLMYERKAALLHPPQCLDCGVGDTRLGSLGRCSNSEAVACESRLVQASRSERFLHFAYEPWLDKGFA